MFDVSDDNDPTMQQGPVTEKRDHCNCNNPKPQNKIRNTKSSPMRRLAYETIMTCLRETLQGMVQDEILGVHVDGIKKEGACAAPASP